LKEDEKSLKKYITLVYLDSLFFGFCHYLSYVRKKTNQFVYKRQNEKTIDDRIQNVKMHFKPIRKIQVTSFFSCWCVIYLSNVKYFNDQNKISTFYQ